MIPVDFIVQPSIDPVLSVATDRHLRRAVVRPSRPRSAVLRVYGFPGDWVSLGRYHLAPSGPPGSGVAVCRRPTGGRTLPVGDGFIGVSLVLPHRSSLFSDDPLALAPHQVLNRYVRGFMEACRSVNLRPYYPGRDVVTVDRRIVAAVSFDTDEQGALLFEAVIANTRDFSILPDLLEVVDRDGVVKAEVLTRDDTSSLARELGEGLSFEEVAELLGRGYEEQFGLTLIPHEMSSLEWQAIEAQATREFGTEHWLHQRSRRADLDRHVSTWTQLGVFEASFALRQDRFIKEIQFAGDFIANSPAIDMLERKLRLCPLDWRVVDGVVREVFSDARNYLLGVGKLRAIADLLVRASAS